LALFALVERKKLATLGMLFISGILGALFVWMEISEFRSLIVEGHGPSGSAFLSSFFTLVGTHGLHVSLGLLWLIVLMVHLWRRGIVPGTTRKLLCWGLFWHFLDVIWIFIFTFVYLFGFL
jgi:cytochrome o ubiquinol oxidase subunit 3